jgi:hypothetical protein
MSTIIIADIITINPVNINSPNSIPLSEDVVFVKFVKFVKIVKFVLSAILIIYERIKKITIYFNFYRDIVLWYLIF